MRNGRPGTAVLTWIRLARVYQKIQQASVEEMREYGLSLGQFDVLATIGNSEGSTQQDVADELLVTKSNVCQLVDRMERAGLVERRPEGRSNRLFLTEEGRQLQQTIIPRHARRIAERLSALKQAEQIELLGLLRRLDHALD